eukprot:TRINITY_DN13792_c0_g2_i1.p1 TRINITY_DN13792_c0_g2~~TRINITY_DN13792_c0_g2_i1.p1  ORF type:complete len:498 (-),score=64.25 TRINITY_DN13792_c0_g2_i1:291-1598(-)
MSHDPNLVSHLLSLSQRCTSMRELKTIHGRLLRLNLHLNTLILAKLLRFAAVSPSGDLHYAHTLFSHTPHPDTFFYNTLIRGYAKTASTSQPISLFTHMRRSSTPPDEFTFNFLLNACSRMLKLGEEIHGQVFKLGFSRNTHVQNALIHLYAANRFPEIARKVFDEMPQRDVVSWSSLVVAHVKARDLDSAKKVFDEMPERDVVAWTALITGFDRVGHFAEALVLFWKMQEAGVQPDEVTILGVVSACANLQDLEAGMSVHCYIEERGFSWMVALCNALIDMYSKCGCLEKAWGVFERMPRRSLVSWNSVILACALHGAGEEALRLFQEMTKEAGVRPDGATFLAAMSACAHEGWVVKGWSLLESMEREHGIAATIEHYGCMAGMLAHAGQLEAAYDLIMSMPVPSNEEVWRVLLSACKIHGNAAMRERIVNRLL